MAQQSEAEGATKVDGWTRGDGAHSSRGVSGHDRGLLFEEVLSAVCEAVQDMVDDAREDVLRGAATSSVGDGGIDCVVVARLCAS